MSHNTEYTRKIIKDYLQKGDWRIKENSNQSYSIQGLYDYIRKHTVSDYMMSIYPREIIEAYKEGYFHIHDFDFMGSYCCGWDFKGLLLKGFNGVPGKVASGPPKHFSVALQQLVNFIFTVQGEVAGANAVSNFDTLLAQYVRYDNLTFKQVKQSIQEFIFHMNVPTRVGFQNPFSNITMDLTCPKDMINEPTILYPDLKYSDFSEEMYMINLALWETMIEGDFKGRPFSFPIPTYNISEDFDWFNPKYIKLWEMTGKYGTPYFANFINSDMKAEDSFSMCCRLRLDKNELMKRRGGLFASAPMTGSIGVVTLNLPRLAFEAKSSIDFFDKVEHYMKLASKHLIIKREFIDELTEKGLYPYASEYLKDVKNKSGSCWDNHFNTIGLIGMNEACLNMLRVDILHPSGKYFAKQTLKFMLDVVQNLQIEHGNLWNLEATPAEGCSFSLAKKDVDKYKNAVNTAGTIDVPYYTNSTNIPVNKASDIFDCLEHQESLQTLYTGGTVLHVFLKEKIDDPRSVEKLVHKILTKFKIPYISITPTYSICSTHGYISGEVFNCPVCEAVTEVYSRVVGYYRPVNTWNKGKQKEFDDREYYE